MATISFGGLGNGLDFGQVVDQLVKVAHLPVDRLTEKKASLNSKSTDYATLSTKLIMLQSAAEKLRLATSYDRSATSVSDDTVLSATGSSTASPGTYQVAVSQLAQSHQIMSVVGFTATTSTVGAGTFSFTVGSGSTQSVTLTATSTLEDLRDQINDLGAGVTASIINGGSDTSPSYRLMLTSTSSGTANVIAVTTDTTTLDIDNTSTTAGSTQLQAAQNAEVVIGSSTTVTLTRSSNTITDAIPGVTLTLLKASDRDGSNNPVPLTVSITRDVSAVKANITALATAYNDVVKFINERNTYDITTKKGGLFFNEPTVKTVLSKIRTALSSTVSGASTLTTTGEIGFKTERDGTITVDAAKLDTLLSSSYTAVKNLFIKQTGITGVAQLMSDAVDALDDVSAGTVTLRKSGLTKQIDSLTDEITKKEDAIFQYETRLKAQYAALDGLLSQLKSQSNYLSSVSSSRQ